MVRVIKDSLTRDENFLRPIETGKKKSGVQFRLMKPFLEVPRQSARHQRTRQTQSDRQSSPLMIIERELDYCCGVDAGKRGLDKKKEVKDFVTSKHHHQQKVLLQKHKSTTFFFFMRRERKSFVCVNEAEAA